jgi:hypothetical protein
MSENGGAKLVAARWAKDRKQVKILLITAAAVLSRMNPEEGI